MENTIKCTIWKIGKDACRITVNDIRYRKLNTACITDMEILLECMEDIKQELQEKENAIVIYELNEMNEWLPHEISL